ncbi:MAG: gp58-like family protein [Streptococcus lutetiensis]
MSKNNVRIAIRDSTDSHNVAFFDNKAGIKYKSANLHRFLAGSASILTIKYNSKDIGSIRSGCKLAFRYKNRDYWLNVMSSEKKGFEVELTAYSLGLELNNETRGEHKPANAMPIAEYVAYYDPEHALTIGVNEVSDKRIKLEWTGKDTILARLFSVANSFGAELDFNVELNDDYSLKRQVLNIYKKGNLGTNKVSQPVRVGKELKVINYSDNIKELRTAVRATGKDGLTIDGLNKKIYDNNKELLYYSSGMTVYAPQSRDRFPSVGKGSNDNWIVKDLGETQYETKEALWGYMYGEIQKISVPEITYEVEGAIDAGIGDTQTLIDDIHFEPALYVQARVSELEDDILTGKVTNSTFINFERKYSQIADSLLKQVEALAEDAAPYIVRLSTDNGYNFKNGQGTSTITAKLEKYSKIVNAKWKWLINNSVVSETSSVKINASQVNGTLNVVAVAIVGGNEAAREYITFTNADDGVGIKSITRYYTTNDKAEGVTAGGQNWSTKPTTPTADKKYMWSYDVITYTNDTSLVTKPAVIGARGDDGLDADTTGITEALEKAKQELTALSANIEKVRNDSLAAVEEAKQQLTTVADDLSKAKTDFQNAVSEVDTKATNLQSDVSNLNTSLSNTAKALQTQGTTLANQAKELQTQASQLTEQAKAQETLTTRVENVETTANGTKTTVSELSKTVTQNGKDITSVSNRTKTVETSLTSAKTSISELQTSVSTAKTDLTNLTKRTKTVEDGLTGTKTNLSELTQTVSNDGKTIASLTSRTKTVEDSVSGLKTTMSSVQKDLTAVTTRTKTVEDDLSGTKTTLSQVQTTANSASQKTAALETGLSGLTAKFENLSVGTTNHFLDSAFETTIQKIGILQNGNVYTPSIDTTEKYYGYNTLKIVCKDSTGVDNPKITYPALAKLKTVQQGKLPDVITISFWGKTDTEGMVLYTRLGFTGYEGSQNVTLATDWERYIVHVKTSSAATNEWLFKFSKAGTVWIAKPQFEFSAIASDYHLAEEDASSKVAEYKQTADQNYASLQNTVQNLDGTVQQNKTVADQTAQGFKTRIESLETYKSGESTRANQYFESAKTETARQLTAERTAIAKDYVAKSTYTSDVTGIRNDLTATTTTANTTKTNLANYQASNDKAVANLQSNLQTANGNISSLQTKVEAVPGQITSAVSAVEGKIPTNVSTRNLILKSNDFANPHKQTGANTTVTSTDDYFVIKSTGYTVNAWGGMAWNMSISEAKAGEQFSILMPVYIDSSVPLDNGWAFALKNHPSNSTAYSYNIPTNKKDQWFNVAITFKAYKDVVFDTYPFYVFIVKNGLVRIKPPMLVRGNLIPSDYQPAFEDTESDINAVSSELKQTKDGMTLLATKTELNTAKSDLQSSITTATNKANAAQNTANNNAKTISTHTTQISALNTGLSAKVSQTDFNTLSGRVTTAENNITAKANELSSKISSLNVGGKNYLPTSRVINRGCSNFSYSNTSKSWTMTVPASSTTFGNGITFNTNSLNILLNGGETLFFGLMIKANKACSFNYDINNALSGTASNDNDDRSKQAWSPSNKSIPANVWTRVWFSYTAKANVPITEANSNFGIVNNTEAITVEIKEVMVAKSNVPVDYQMPDADFEAKDSELKQTTDSIKASVSSLDKSTVKSASLTINTDGIVMKAGKSTTDVANAIGSYFAVNQNAINLFSDKINVKGSMIVDGAITGDKIKANSVDVTKIVGIDADYIKAKIEYAMIDWLKGKTITAYNDNMTIDLQNGRISFKDGSNAVYRQTPDGIHTGFLHFEAGSQGGIYAAFGATSTRQGINSKSSEFAGIRCYRVSANGDSHDAKIDKIEVIGDTVQFGHGYRSDGSIGGGFIMDTAAYANETPYSLNRVIKSIEALWRILHDHAKNAGYRFNDSAFISALNNEYNAWHDMHND